MLVLMLLKEKNSTFHYNINADLKTTLVVELAIAIKFSDGGANANCMQTIIAFNS